MVTYPETAGKCREGKSGGNLEKRLTWREHSAKFSELHRKDARKGEWEAGDPRYLCGPSEKGGRVWEIGFKAEQAVVTAGGAFRCQAPWIVNIPTPPRIGGGNGFSRRKTAGGTNRPVNKGGIMWMNRSFRKRCETRSQGQD